MSGRTIIWGMHALGIAFIASAAAFMVAIGIYSGEPWALTVRHWTGTAAPYVSGAVRTADERAFRLAGAWLIRQGQTVAEWGRAAVSPRETGSAKPAVVATSAPAKLRPSISPVLPAPQAAPATKAESPTGATGAAGAAGAPAMPDEALPPAVDPHPPAPAEMARVAQHLKASLSQELFDNFKLFLYVSKAGNGPWAQRMYVYGKADGGKLSLMYSWPVSTGREQHEVSASGRNVITDTPPGYYQFDGGRMHKHYVSHQWQHPMPYTMFFNWEKNGMPTGLAIHSAYGDEDIARLGSRASAGCVRLAPRNAQVLFNLVRSGYRGDVPLFAFDKKTYTIHNDGQLMHDTDGKLKYVSGYQVLVFIENYGGADLVAALF
jgi:lipoprotein-anchoring transpeptidase ErfK/SrfK